VTEYLGWSATAVFVGSYFWSHADAIRRVQMFGALMWVAYGVMIEAYPVVVANVLVCAAAAWTMTRGSAEQPPQGRVIDLGIVPAVDRNPAHEDDVVDTRPRQA
jgi:hypothetical protein